MKDRKRSHPIIGSQYKILIADDDVLVCSVIEEHLKQKGCETILINSGEDVLDSVKINKPDLVLLDIIMPKVDGLFILRELKKDPSLARLPVVLLSARNQQEDILKGLTDGAHDYITKPFNVNELSSKIFSLLQDE